MSSETCAYISVVSLVGRNKNCSLLPKSLFLESQRSWPKKGLPPCTTFYHRYCEEGMCMGEAFTSDSKNKGSRTNGQ